MEKLKSEEESASVQVYLTHCSGARCSGRDQRPLLPDPWKSKFYREVEGYCQPSLEFGNIPLERSGSSLQHYRPCQLESKAKPKPNQSRCQRSCHGIFGPAWSSGASTSDALRRCKEAAARGCSASLVQASEEQLLPVKACADPAPESPWDSRAGQLSAPAIHAETVEQE